MVEVQLLVMQLYSVSMAITLVDERESDSELHIEMNSFEDVCLDSLSSQQSTPLPCDDCLL